MRPITAHFGKKLLSIIVVALIIAIGIYQPPFAASATNTLNAPDNNGVRMQARTRTVKTVPTPVPAAPPEVNQYAIDWPLMNKDYSQTRYTIDSPITCQNVNTLDVDWSFTIPGIGRFGGAASNPIVMGGNVFFQDLRGNVFALDFETGAVKWQRLYDTPNAEGPNGVAVGWGKVFVHKDAYTVAALDANTGIELWANKLSSIPTTGIDIQPMVYDNLVFTSTVPGTSDLFYAPGGIGMIYALDQATGSIVWQFSTVDTPELWGHPEVNSGGGCWYPPAIDPETGDMYWAIANPAPFPGTAEWPNGSSRPGPNLYTNSLMALDHASGQVRWYNQVLPHDLFDHDLQISPVLTTIVTAGGVPQDIVITAGKMGSVYAFDRASGALLWKTDVGEHNEASDLDAMPEGTTTVIPSAIGGVETVIACADGIVYVPVVDLASDWTPSEFVRSTFNFANGKGELVAVDAATGKILWIQKFDSMALGGATVANDVVFTGTYDGWIYGFQRMTGQEVFKFKAPAGINAWPAIVDDTIIWPCGVGGLPSVIALRLKTSTMMEPAIKSINVELTSASGQGTPTASPTRTPGATATSATASPTATRTPGATASPAAGSPVADVKVTLNVQNFNLVNRFGNPPAMNEGHIHFFMDAQPPTTAGSPATTAPGTFVLSANTTYTWRNVTAGIHTFSAELVNNDHTPLSPPVVAQVVANVQTGPNFSMAGADVTMVAPSPAPGGTPTPSAIPAASPTRTPTPGPTRTASPSPTPSVTPPPKCVPVVEVMGADVKISVNVSNFNIVDKQGQTASPGQGHIHYYMDVTAPTTSGKPAVTANGTWVTTTAKSYTWHDVSPGLHNFSVQLVNNDHTPISPAVVDTILIEVPVVPVIVPGTPVPTTSPTPTRTPSATTSPTVSPSPAASPSASASASAAPVTVNLSAQGLAFNTNSITVPAGARVTVNFNNMDSGIPHNLAVYTDSTAATPIFVGNLITGPATTVYTFTAPSTPGTYFFRCDVHPTQMTGNFIVR